MTQQTNPMFVMAGTEKTFQYVVLLLTTLGRLGIRTLAGKTRIRIEPASADTAALLKPFFPRSSDWKQPGDSGEDRFSIVVPDSQTEATVLDAMTALLSDSAPFRADGDSSEWLQAFVANGSAIAANPALSGDNHMRVHAGLVAKARGLKIPGCNLAKNWGVRALIHNLVTAEPAVA